jgi:hypothetical protein
MTRTTRLGLIGMVVAVALMAHGRETVATLLLLLLTSFVLYMLDD